MIPLLSHVSNVESVLEGLKIWFLSKGVNMEGPCKPKFFLSWLQIFSKIDTIVFAPTSDQKRGSWRRKAKRDDRCEAVLSKCTQAGRESHSLFIHWRSFCTLAAQ